MCSACVLFNSYLLNKASNSYWCWTYISTLVSYHCPFECIVIWICLLFYQQFLSLSPTKYTEYIWSIKQNSDTCYPFAASVTIITFKTSPNLKCRDKPSLVAADICYLNFSGFFGHRFGFLTYWGSIPRANILHQSSFWSSDKTRANILKWSFDLQPYI